MSSILLHALDPKNLDVELHLRLLNAWKLCDPTQPNSFFGFGTHWTDSEGTTIQGESHKKFAALLQSRITVGSVYKITGFGLRPRRKSFRTSTFPHCLDLTPTTQFQIQQPTTPLFCLDSLQCIEFEDLPTRVHPPSAYLTDFVGKFVSGGEPGHIERPNAVALVQKLIVANERGMEVEVSLWGDLAQIIDATPLALSDDSNPAIIAFAAFRITLFSGNIKATSCTASRVCLHPSDHRANELRSFFSSAPRAITYVPPRFSTPEKLHAHIRESYRTLSQLLALYADGGDSEPRYRCAALIKGFETHAAWFYKACPQCFKAVAPNHNNFWYRLKLIVSDSTTEASFVLLGMTAERILPISAAELFSHSNPFGDFKICNIHGLTIPRAELLNKLPTPIPENPLCSTPSTHNTPLPGDPDYVAPVPTYVSPTMSPQHADDHLLSKEIPAPADQDPLPPTKAQPVKKKPCKKLDKTQATPSRGHPRKSISDTTAKTTSNQQSPSLSEDDQPLSQVLLAKKMPSISPPAELSLPNFSTASRSSVAAAITPPPHGYVFASNKHPALHNSTPPDTSSKSKLTLPLAKVKIEKLQAASTTIPATPQPLFGDGLHAELGRGKRKQTRKRLFEP